MCQRGSCDEPDLHINLERNNWFDCSQCRRNTVMFWSVCQKMYFCGDCRRFQVPNEATAAAPAAIA